MTDVAALIPAAGAGQRLGLGPKAFIGLGGVTLLERAFALLAPYAEELIVAVPAGYEEEARRLAAPTEIAGGGAARHVTVLRGGATRQATVERLLAATDATWIVVHDAARPLTPPEVVAHVLEAARRHGAATAVLPVADTLHDMAANLPVAREGLCTVQTPQAFSRSILQRAHVSARQASRQATDDAQLVRALGHPVATVHGSPWSHKLTAPDDLPWLEALAFARDSVRG